jgi:hypothetical protein
MERRAKTLRVTVALFLLVISDAVVRRSYADGMIVTHRLSRSDQRIWNSIRKIVLAQDRQGRPNHPKLYDLWQSVEASRHEVSVELIDGGVFYSNQAGKFTIEAFDPSGRHHICSIRLNLATIRRAFTKASAMRPDGFVPMAELGEMERYAEVLGHELAHAVGIMQDPDYLRLYQDIQKEVAEYERHLNNPDGVQDDQETHLARIQIMQRAFEKRAEAAEVEIWRELRQPGVKNVPVGRR